jgi:release factor glutamine methyltransferase
MAHTPKSWTILELLQTTQKYFAGCGIQTPRLDAELLLGHCLNKDRLRLYLDFEALVTEAELSSFRDLVRRRGKREPLAYIVGYKDFWSLRLQVTPAVLIPRPETEVLVEHAAGLFRGTGPAILDIGTGTGAIAIALARELPAAAITATDISDRALDIARQNAEACCPAKAIAFITSDGLSAVAGRRFDCIVSNPPYIASADIDTLEPEIHGYEPRLALDGGPDGLDFYRRCIPGLAACLNPGGAVFFEIGCTQGPAVRELLAAAGFTGIHIIDDYARRPRVAAARLA